MKKAIGLTSDAPCTPSTDTQSDPCAMVESLMIPHDAMWSTVMMYTQPYPSDLLQHVPSLPRSSILL